MSTPVLDADPSHVALWRRLLALDEWPAHNGCEDDPAIECSIFQLIAEHLQPDEPTPIQKTLTEWVRKAVDFAASSGDIAESGFFQAGGRRRELNDDILGEDGNTYRIVLERVER